MSKVNCKCAMQFTVQHPLFMTQLWNQGLTCYTLLKPIGWAIWASPDSDCPAWVFGVAPIQRVEGGCSWGVVFNIQTESTLLGPPQNFMATLTICGAVSVYHWRSTYCMSDNWSGICYRVNLEWSSGCAEFDPIVGGITHWWGLDWLWLSPPVEVRDPLRWILEQ